MQLNLQCGFCLQVQFSKLLLRLLSSGLLKCLDVNALFNNLKQYLYTVKFIALLLSVVVLTLTSVPCCGMQKNSTEQYNAQDHSKDEDDCGQSCSPFYSCNTCIGFTISNYLKESFAINLRPVLHNSIYLTVELPQTTSSIWQPPQLR